MLSRRSGVSPRLNTVLSDAFKTAEKMKDAYVSSEHLLVALAGDKGDAGRVLERAGVTPARLSAAIDELRQGSKVTDQNPEAQMQALERYGRNLTEMARDGKLDPVIGRNEEIRRAIQVLSRRTKNNPVLIGEPGTGKTAIVEGSRAAHRRRRRALEPARQRRHHARPARRWSRARSTAASSRTGSRRCCARSSRPRGA